MGSVIGLLADSGAHVNLQDVEGQTPLHTATIKGNLDAVEQLLRCRGIAIETSDVQGMTSLHVAATHGYTAVLSRLIRAGASLHSCDHDQMSPLHFAASEGNVESIKLILDRGEAEGGNNNVRNMLFRMDAGKNTCLHLAVSKGHEHAVSELIGWAKKLQELDRFITMPRSHNETSLHLAAAQGHLAVAGMLIDNGASVTARNDSLATALLLAAHNNNFKLVELLLERGAGMEARDKDNLTALLTGCKHGHMETAAWLIEHGADVSAVDKNDKSCLMLAVEENRISAVQELLKYANICKLLEDTDRNANGVLHIAAKKGYLPIIKIVIANGARTTLKNEDEATPVHIAAQHGQHQALRELLNRDQSVVNGLDENACTALHLSAFEGHLNCVKVLLEHGASVTSRNTKQWTALDCACARGWESCVLELLEAGSIVNPPPGSRTTPLHQACHYGHERVAELLLKWRANVSSRVLDGKNPLDDAIATNNPECARVILEDDNWKRAMRNCYLDVNTGLLTTPMRQLIVSMPEMAEVAFGKCITDNDKQHDDVMYKVTLDYEFLDDMYSLLEWMPTKSDLEHLEVEKRKKSYLHHFNIPKDELTYKAFDEDDRIDEDAVTYVESSAVLRHNHPLMIMVNRKREALLQHPVVTGLLQYKWNKYGGYVYYSSLLFLVISVLLLNVYLMIFPPPYAIDYAKSMANRRYYQQFSSERLVSHTAPRQCYSMLKKGVDYRGFANSSISGKPCVRWDATSTNHFVFPDAGLELNFCRNPGTEQPQPWCFTNYSATQDQFNVKELCAVERCTVYATGNGAPEDAECVFPFMSDGVTWNECIKDDTGQWCGFVPDLEADDSVYDMWGFCSEVEPNCIIAEHLRTLCGRPGIDRLVCEARGCCFEVFDEGLSSEWSECYLKRGACEDRDVYCPVWKADGYCDVDWVAADCEKTCGYCNDTESAGGLDNERKTFLYLLTAYPEFTFDEQWEEGCYYVLPGAEPKWGGGCHFNSREREILQLLLVVLCFVNLTLLTLQIINYKTDALHPVFFIEAAMYIMCLLLVWNYDTFDVSITQQMRLEIDRYQPIIDTFQKETGLRQNWQWQCGAMSLFLSWMDLLLYIRKIPYLGIYVVMFNDVLSTFVKFFLVFLLFILSFAFTFHALLQNEAQFEQPFQAIIKTTVMMVGEIDFGGILFGSQEQYDGKVNFPAVTYIIFTIFIFVMMIIIMNLLVGLAVGDIMEVQAHATLERLKMQVALALEVEFSVPNFLRKRFVRKNQTLKPNKFRRFNPVLRAFLQNSGLTAKSITRAINPDKTCTEETRDNVVNLANQVNQTHRKASEIDITVHEIMKHVRDTMRDMRELTGEVREIRDSKRARDALLVRISRGMEDLDSGVDEGLTTRL